MTQEAFLSNEVELKEQQNQPEKDRDDVEKMVRGRFRLGTKEYVPKAGNAQNHRTDHEQILKSVFSKIRHFRSSSRSSIQNLGLKNDPGIQLVRRFDPAVRLRCMLRVVYREFSRSRRRTYEGKQER